VYLSDYRSHRASSLRDRSTLLGVTPPSSGRSSPFNDQYNSNGHRFADDLEGQNDEQLEGLSAKVKLLKDVSESRLKPLLHSPRLESQ
jgi:blocked-early-in-transport protein 1